MGSGDPACSELVSWIFVEAAVLVGEPPRVAFFRRRVLYSHSYAPCIDFILS